MEDYEAEYEEFDATSDPDERLSIYVAYEDYFSAEQLTSILSTLDRVYNYLMIARDADLSLPLQPEARMRIVETRTGHSIIVELAEGVRQAWDATQPILEIAGPMGTMSAMAVLILRMAKGLVSVRNSWLTGGANAAKTQAEAAKTNAEADKIRAETENLRRKDDTEREPNNGLSEIALSDQREISRAILDFLTYLEFEPNIIEVRINDVTILMKQ